MAKSRVSDSEDQGVVAAKGVGACEAVFYSLRFADDSTRYEIVEYRYDETDVLEWAWEVHGGPWGLEVGLGRGAKHHLF